MEKLMNFITRVRIILIALLFFTGSFTYGTLPKVLLVAADEDPFILDVQAKLSATGMFSVVDIVDTRTVIPDFYTLKKYNAVLVWTDDDPLDYELLGDNLAAYIENGGGVVDAVFDNASIPVLGDYDSSAYRCLVPLDQISGSVRTLDTFLLPDHPVVKNVLSFDAGINSFLSTSDSITPGSYIIASYDNDAICIAARENVGSAKVRRVSLNFFPPSSDAQADFWDVNTDGDLIMANALTWVSNLYYELPNVLIGGPQSNGSWIVDVKNKLLATGMFSEIDTINLISSTPSLPTISQYKAIFFWGDQDFADTALLGNNLASYIDAGGVVVDAQFALSNGYQIGGRYKSEEYQCILPDDETSGNVRILGTIERPGHAIMTGVTSFNGGSSSYHSTSLDLAPEAYIITRYDNDEILIAAKENVGPMNTRRVSLNFFPPSSGMRGDLWDVTTDGAKIMANALIWALNDNNTLNFDGVNDYISTEINPDEGVPFTWMASVFPTDESNEKMILGTCSNIDTWDGMWFEVSGTNRLRFYVDADDIYSDDQVPVNQWSNVAVTYDSTSVRIYINGLLQGEMVKDLTAVDGGYLHVGAIGSGSFESWMFNGNQDNISIWNRALTSAEILKLQNRKLSGSEPGLEAYYDFNQGIAGGDNPTDTILFDRKTSAYDGLLHNFALTGVTSNWVGSLTYTTNNIPSVQAKNVTFGEVSGDQVNVGWTRGNGEACAVFIKNASSGSAFPEFETSYTADPDFGDGTQISTSGWYCVYNGTGTSVILNDLTLEESYIVHVCEYSGTSENEEYNMSTVLNNPGVILVIPDIYETPVESDIRVYPNPASNYLIIESSDDMVLQYTLFELSGQVILKGTLNGTYLNLSGLNPGMYILDMNMTNKFRIIKQ